MSVRDTFVGVSTGVAVIVADVSRVKERVADFRDCVVELEHASVSEMDVDTDCDDVTSCVEDLVVVVVAALVKDDDEVFDVDAISDMEAAVRDAVPVDVSEELRELTVTDSSLETDAE